MKQIAVLLSLSILAVSAFAGQKPAAKAPTKIKCAVMTSNEVDIKTATKAHMYADYKGNRYYFCCGGCPGQFKANPAKFAKSPHVKTPKK